MSGRPSDQWLSPEALETSVNATLVTSSAYIGLVTTYHGGGNVSLNASNAFIGLATVVVGTPESFSYKALTSVSTVNVKAGAGILHTVNIGLVSCPTTIFYDSLTCSGTVMHVMSCNPPVGSYVFDAIFATGLSIDGVTNTNATYAAIPQITVTYK